MALLSARVSVEIRSSRGGGGVSWLQPRRAEMRRRAASGREGTCEQNKAGVPRRVEHLERDRVGHLFVRQTRTGETVEGREAIRLSFGRDKFGLAAVAGRPALGRDCTSSPPPPSPPKKSELCSASAHLDDEEGHEGGCKAEDSRGAKRERVLPHDLPGARGARP